MVTLSGLGGQILSALGCKGDSTSHTNPLTRFYMSASALSAGYMNLQPGGDESPKTMFHVRPEPDEFEMLANHKFHELLDKFEELKNHEDAQG